MFAQYAVFSHSVPPWAEFEVPWFLILREFLLNICRLNEVCKVRTYIAQFLGYDVHI